MFIAHAYVPKDVIFFWIVILLVTGWFIAKHYNVQKQYWFVLRIIIMITVWIAVIAASVIWFGILLILFFLFVGAMIRSK